MTDEYALGMDEAGRGPLAGPVYGAAVILGSAFPREILNDSKKITPRRRDTAFSIIQERAFLWGIARVEAYEIDEINIHHASLLVMKRAFGIACFGEEYPGGSRGGIVLRDKREFPANEISRIRADGKFIPDLADYGITPSPRGPLLSAEIKGDSRFPEIMAASILAKVARDRFMEDLDQEYPDYGFKKHKGYPTRLHRERIALHGITPYHRKSFNLLGRDCP